jgi:hypothetical protein
MSIHQQIAAAPAFPDAARVGFGAAYPDRPAMLTHSLADHPLFAREALAELADRTPAERIEHNLGNVPLGIRAEDVPANGLSAGDTVRSIDSNGSWMVLKNVERDPAFGALLDTVLAELAPIVDRRTGAMLHREAFIFLSSPDSVTPFHMDPEHNILLQIKGEKAMTVFPAGDPVLVPAEQSESFHAGGHRNLNWEEDFAAMGIAHRLTPGTALHVPVKAPHFVRNGPCVSISFSITWRSARSVAEGELHSLNAKLRCRRLPTIRIDKRPERQFVALTLHRILRRLGVA